MKRHGFDELERLLGMVDARLDENVRVIVIGGAAVALQLRAADIVTKDVDTWENSGALTALAREVGLELTPTPIAEMPYHFEDRLDTALRYTKLQVLVPERHDLVLSKIVRWHEGDEDHARKLHDARPLDLDVLLERYRSEMTHVAGHPARIRGHFVDCVRTLFGELASARAARALA